MRPINAALVISLALGLPALAQAQFKSTWPLDGRIAVTDSTVPGRSTEDTLKSGGGDLELHFSPILGWTQSRWLILPSVDLNTTSANTILKVDDQRFEFLAQSTTHVELGTAFKRTPDQRFGIRAFGESFQAKQAVNESLTTGQYNYEDSGVSMDWRQKWNTNTPFRSTLGLSATNRSYPNWQSLDPDHHKEKDQAITRLYTDLEWSWVEWTGSTVIGFSTQTADFKDANLVGADALTTTAKRKDQVTDLSLDVPFELGRNAISFGVHGTVWDSNLTDYDTQNNYWTENYGDFLEGSGHLGYAYNFKGPWAWGFFKSPQLTLDLDLILRQYIQRPAKNDDGSLQPEVERDFTRNFGLGYNSAYTDHWAMYVKINHLESASNNHDQSSALYNYVFNTFSLGLNFFY